jgi:hypothetical protein
MSGIDPEKLREAIDLVAEHLGGWGPSDLRAAERLLVDAANAHLSTLPKTKEVEVWRVEFAGCVATALAEWRPMMRTFTDRVNAESMADSMRGDKSFACIRVTGPHKQTVPA